MRLPLAIHVGPAIARLLSQLTLSLVVSGGQRHLVSSDRLSLNSKFQCNFATSRSLILVILCASNIQLFFCVLYALYDEVWAE
ncbi:hypothetical protein DFH07DRAFT_92850 [Mycena maculata]|uniref:Uncharacterized protein n=1 Tax=Mycena maculata TaxID=230809 RepID=A0AAD7MYA1_9AGAR|nr:hypothetical protein DFH07DRAFT_92850 [Mycena maculata]